MKEGPKEKFFFFQEEKASWSKRGANFGDFFSFFSQLTQCQDANFPQDICGLFIKDPVLRIEMIASVTLYLCPLSRQNTVTQAMP